MMKSRARYIGHAKALGLAPRCVNEIVCQVEYVRDILEYFFKIANYSLNDLNMYYIKILIISR